MTRQGQGIYFFKDQTDSGPHSVSFSKGITGSFPAGVEGKIG